MLPTISCPIATSQTWMYVPLREQILQVMNNEFGHRIPRSPVPSVLSIRGRKKKSKSKREKLEDYEQSGALYSAESRTGASVLKCMNGTMVYQHRELSRILAHFRIKIAA